MSTTCRYNPRNIEVNLIGLEPWLYDEIVSLRGHIEPPPAPPIFTCLKNFQPMYIYQHQSGRYFARHYPGGNDDGHTHPISAMSVEHRNEAEYVQRAAADHGLKAALEVSTGNGTRLDVGVYGDLADVGFEVQRSELSRAKAQSRATKSFNAGWITAWISDQQRDPEWMRHVPAARLVVRDDWNHLPRHNSVNVIISDFIRERDKSKKSGWRYSRNPRAVLLDELAYLMPTGEIVPVVVGAKKYKSVVLAPKYAVELIDSCTYPGASKWSPTSKTPQHQVAPQMFTKNCHHATVLELDEPLHTITEAEQLRLRCPGCDRMHMIHPCYTGCRKVPEEK